MNWPDFVSSSQSLLSAGNYAHFVVDTQSVLEAKDWWNTTDGTKTVESRLASNHLYGVVFGHQPKALGVEDDVGGIDSLHIIKIDSGMAPAKEEGAHGNFGHLLFFPHASDLNLMSPPAAFSLGVNSSRQL